MPALLGVVAGAAFVLGVGLIVSDLRHRRRTVRRQRAQAEHPSVGDEVENWLRYRR